MAQTVGSWGVAPAAAYHVSAQSGDSRSLLEFFSYAFLFAAVSSGVVVAAAYAVLGLFTPLPWRESLSFVLWSASITAAGCGAAYLQGQGQYGRFNCVRVISAAGPGMATVVLFVVGKVSLTTLGGAYAISGIVAAAAAVAWLGPKWPFSRPAIRRARSAPFAADAWRFGRHSVLSNLTMAANSRVDQLVLSVTVPTSALGVYAVATSVAYAYTPVLGAISIVAFRRLAAPQPGARRITEIRRLAVIVSLCSVAISGVVMLLIPIAVPRLYGSRFGAAVGPCLVLTGGSVFVALNNLLEDGLRATGRPGTVGLAEGAGALVTAAIVLLVNALGLIAVASGAVLGYIVTFAVCVLALRSSVRDP